MQIIDTFSGIGGFSLAGRWIGWRTIHFCEIDPWCHKVLKKHWPNVPIHTDIKTLTPEIIKQNPLYDENEETIITGGVPCQPASTAGKRRGESDERWLWPQTIKFIGEFKPTLAVLENVAGLVSMENGKTLDRILSDLEDEGYTTEQVIIPACAVGAWHRRDRIWIIAHSQVIRGERERGAMGEKTAESFRKNDGAVIDRGGKDAPDTKNARTRKNNGGIRQGVSGVGRGEGTGKKDVADSISGGQPRQGQYVNAINTTESRNGEAVKLGHGCLSDQRCVESDLGGMVDGLPYWVDGYWDREPKGVPRVATGVKDRVNRLKGLGNAIVPAVALEIFRAIQEISDENTK